MIFDIDDFSFSENEITAYAEELPEKYIYKLQISAQKWI